MDKGLILATLLLAGCQTAATSDCAVLRDPPPLTTADVDAVSDPLARWLDATIEKGQRLCGWRAPR